MEPGTRMGKPGNKTNGGWDKDGGAREQLRLMEAGTRMGEPENKANGGWGEDGGT